MSSIEYFFPCDHSSAYGLHNFLVVSISVNHFSRKKLMKTLTKTRKTQFHKLKIAVFKSLILCAKHRFSRTFLLGKQWKSHETSFRSDHLLFSFYHVPSESQRARISFIFLWKLLQRLTPFWQKEKAKKLDRLSLLLGKWAPWSTIRIPCRARSSTQVSPVRFPIMIRREALASWRCYFSLAPLSIERPIKKQIALLQ